MALSHSARLGEGVDCRLPVCDRSQRTEIPLRKIARPAGVIEIPEQEQIGCLREPESSPEVHRCAYSVKTKSLFFAMV